jgi:signal transduction histidine kinase/CheY-like chemotaxis protein
MSATLNNYIRRHLGGRAFRDRELEHEFQHAFRFAGARFLEIGTGVSGLAYVVLFMIHAFTKGSFTEQPQPLRLVVIAILLSVSAASRWAKPSVTRYYELICMLAIAFGMLFTSIISIYTGADDTSPTRYWGGYSAAVFGTCVIYGFTRLSALNTVILAGVNAGVALWFAKEYGADARVMQRLVVHLICINLICYTLYRMISIRERKLFLRGKRQVSIGDLKRARDKAEEASRAKSAFLANMSHEIRTPMNGIIGSLALLARTDSEERRRTLIDVASQAATGLLQTLNEILDYAKLDAKSGTVRHESMDLRRVCQLAIQTFQANATAKGIALRFDASGYPADLWFVRGDEEKLRRVVMNLVSNAIKFTSEGGVTLRLRGTRRDGSVDIVLRVADTGIGIAPDKVPLLFQPFYQVESGMSRSYGGTGLGLAISRQLVELMGGKVQLRSAVGRGSVFTVRLRLDMGVDLTQTIAAVPVLAPDGLSLAKGKSVLLVEDNAVNAFISAASLETMGVTSIHAVNGDEAVKIYRSRAFDAVLMDCEMPVMDGFAATQLIREFETASGRRRTPIIALTANALSGDREQCLKHGMDDYLSKPIELHQLAAIVFRWLGDHDVSMNSPEERRDMPTLSVRAA